MKFNINQNMKEMRDELDKEKKEEIEKIQE